MNTARLKAWRARYRRERPQSSFRVLPFCEYCGRKMLQRQWHELTCHRAPADVKARARIALGLYEIKT